MLRCVRCNLDSYVEIRKQPDGEGMFKNFLKKRTYMHCKGCGLFIDMDDYKKGVLRP